MRGWVSESVSVCVCVCEPLLHALGLRPTKLPVKWDIQLGQLDVPASMVPFISYWPWLLTSNFSAVTTEMHG